MKALTVLFGGRLAGEAFEPLFPEPGATAFSRALERARAFPGTEKCVLLAGRDADYPPAEGAEIVRRDWTVAALLETLSEASAGFDLTYFAWADTPFLDPALAGRLAERHLRFAADYSFADGWPEGVAPELLGPGLAGVLYKIAGDAGAGRVERGTIFDVLQKDINSFDIETEISPEDLRLYRLRLAADSKRNLLLLRRFAAGERGEGLDEEGIRRFIAANPGALRTLPAFFPIQVADACPALPPGEGAAEKTASCAFCPYRASAAAPAAGRFMEAARFGELLDKIEAFAGDAVIDLSAWGEAGLHPEAPALAGMALARPALALVIETTGLGWKADAARAIAEAARAAPARKNGMAPVSWIVSLNENDLPAAAGGGAGAAGSAFALRLAELFPAREGGQKTVYVQAVRTKGAEDAIERFYRAWKTAGPALGSAAGPAAAPEIIIQKYNDFCKALPERNAVDLSPVRRRPCWHIMRDFPVLLDGGVPFCLNASPRLWKGEEAPLGNVWNESLEAIWERGEARYLEHSQKRYKGICAGCDEYYTYNF